jgi:hypothetical protein
MSTQLGDASAPPKPRPFAEILARKDPGERLAAYGTGAFTIPECIIWAARYPEKVAIANDELEWIAPRPRRSGMSCRFTSGT